jgi:hypothetical protein
LDYSSLPIDLDFAKVLMESMTIRLAYMKITVNRGFSDTVQAFREEFLGLWTILGDGLASPLDYGDSEAVPL